MDYIYVKTINDYVKYIEYLSNFASIALDTETCVPLQKKHLGYTALDCHVAEISLIQLIGHIPTNIQKQPSARLEVGELSKVVILDLIELNKLSYDKTLLIRLLTNAESIIGVNIQFDLKFLYKELGVFFDNSVCLRAMSLLIGNATGSKFNKLIGNSFKSLCRDYLNIHLQDKGAGSAQTTDWYTRPTNKAEQLIFNKKLKYASNDVIYIFYLWVKLYNTICLPLLPSPLIEDSGLEETCGLGMYEVYKLEMRLISVIAEMEYNGLHVDKTLLEEIEEANKVRLNEVTIELASYLKVPLPINRFTNEPEVTDEIINILNSPKKLIIIINSLLKLEVSNTTSTLLRRTSNIIEKLYGSFSNNKNKNEYEDEDEDEDEIESEDIFVDEKEASFYKDIIERDDLKNVKHILNLILEYKQISKQLSQSLIPFINEQTNCIHSSFNSLGASTSRTTSNKP